MKVILDFDCTIFNTDKFRGKIESAFAKYGVDRALFYDTLERSKNGGRDWKPEIQFKILKKHGAPNIDKIQDKFENVLGSAHLFLYEDTIPFLERIKKIHPLSILSYGEGWFQNTKIEKANVSAYFENVVVTRNIHKDKEASNLSEGKKSIFVEDNPSALSATKKHAPHIITVRINRGDGRYAQEASGEGIDYEVKDLGELEEIIL